jgi:hypothetical protein
VDDVGTLIPSGRSDDRFGWIPDFRPEALRRQSCAAFGHSRYNEFVWVAGLYREIGATGHADRVALKIVA